MEWCLRGLYLRKSAFICGSVFVSRPFVACRAIAKRRRIHSRSQFAGEMVGGDVHSVS